MRFRLTPQGSALPSPARPRAHPAGPCTRPACVRTSPPLGAVGRALTGHWSAATCPELPCLRSPPEGGSLSEAPPPWCGSPSLGFRTSRQYVCIPSRPELPDPEDIRPWLSLGVRPRGGGLGKHRVARKWPSCGAPWLSRQGLQELGSFLVGAGTGRPRPCGRSAAPAGELANGRRGRQYNVERQ